MTNRKELIVVLGMHRSGTSAITRGLQVLGVSLGERLMPAIENINARGFWEDIDLNSLNIEMLQAIGSDWFYLAPINVDDINKLHKDGYFLRATELLREKVCDVPIFGFKDPRVAKLLPFWKEVFNHCRLNVKYVLAIRHPLSVVKSLAKRDGFVEEHSYLLWLGHTLESLIGSIGKPRVLVDYDCMMQSPDAELMRVARALNLEIDNEELHNYKIKFLDESLRHTKYGYSDLLSKIACPAIVQEVYSTLLDVVSDSVPINDNKLSAKISCWTAEFEQLRSALILADKLLSQKASVSRDISERDGQIASLNETVTERDEKIANLSQTMIKYDEQIIRLNQVLAEREKIITVIYASKSWRITAPLRVTRTIGSHMTIKFRRTSGKMIRRIYHGLPLSYYKKSALKDWIFSNFSTFVSWTNTYQRWAEYKGLITDHTIANIKQRECLLASKKREGTLEFDDPSDPLVSIVIPVYNNWTFTEACLWSVKNNSGTEVAYEVIIADDCSTDETKSRLAEISGLKVLANEKNLGFLRNCNNAVKHTRGRYIVLLNNDTEVSQNWLVLMLNVFSNFDRVGVVAAKLIYPDSRVQEAGGIMMSNGWAHPYGRFEEPEKYEFNYVKEVDCAIGACLMIEKALFEKIGGFDERYAPAHYEEFDFEFSVRTHGYKVMYQPAVQIIHYESISGGSEFRNRQSIINHEKFCEKWAAELASRPVSETELYLARDSSINSKCILVIEDMVPHHDKNAGAVTIFQYIKLLRDLGFKVVFLPDNLNPVQPYTSDLQQMGIEVIYGKFDFQAWFRTNGQKFDYCWLCRPDVSIKYIDIIRAESSACILYYTHDLHYLREYRCYELEGDKWHLQESNRLKAIELEIFRHVNVVLTPSSDEEVIIRELSPKSKVLTIPAYMYEISERTIAGEIHGYKERKGLLFLGGYNHAPNVDAVLWFAKEVFPLIRSRLPDVVFCVAGSNVPNEIQKLDGSAIQILGYVSDLSKLFNEFRVFVAPLRYGAGVKGKIVTSLYYGVPVVTTSIGNEGLSLANGDQALVGDSAMELADQICRLYQEPDLWEQLSVRGGDYIRERFSVESARNAILRATSIVAERCYICGKNVFFSPAKDISNLRESHICTDCWTLKRTNDLAYVLVQLHGGHKKDSLCSMLDVLSKLDIYEIGFVGPIHDLLSETPGFVCSEYFDDVAIGEISTLGIRCEDVERLTFPSMSFDLIISQDVFEHVPNPVQGFREIFRVLKNGGIHAFTIPYSKYRAESLQRARIDDGVVQWLTEPVYHGDPIREKGALVFTDFGRDLVNSLTQTGFQIELHEFEFSEYQGGSNTVFIARKPTNPTMREML
ncbi:glycosyltransferase [Nitrosomonas europaea]|uniref:glycosyltransferase n=1 Tax=Nitrosomonas europaea TaxID=915 RepID=UPI002BDF8F11|nr:glycosyltransferase [Nitrosomonas europaea]HRN82734.1 glycosyltransferase [Nitrosomonas europaea]